MFVQKTLGIVNCLSRSRIEKKQKTLEEKRDWKKFTAFNRDKKNNPITSSSSLPQKRSTNQQPFLPNFFRDKRTHTRINWTKIPANNPHSSSWRRIIHSPIVVTTSPIRTHLRPKKEKKGRRKKEDSRTELLFVQRGVFPFHFLFFPSPWYFFLLFLVPRVACTHPRGQARAASLRYRVLAYRGLWASATVGGHFAVRLTPNRFDSIIPSYFSLLGRTAFLDVEDEEYWMLVISFLFDKGWWYWAAMERLFLESKKICILGWNLILAWTLMKKIYYNITFANAIDISYGILVVYELCMI